MSLINDALKRAQQAQTRPSSTYTSALQPAPKTPRRTRTNIQLASGGLVIVFSLGVWLWYSQGKLPNDGTPDPVADTRKSGQPLTAPGPRADLHFVAQTPAPLPTQAPETTTLSEPVPSPTPTRGSVQVPQPEMASFKPARTATPPPEKLAPVPYATYVVKPRDTLIRIAKLHRTTVKAIRGLNDLKSERILVGQKLNVPSPTTSIPTS